MKRTPRQKAILRRNLFITACVAALISIIAVICFIISAIVIDNDIEDNNSEVESVQSIVTEESENTSSAPAETEPETVTMGEYTLDATYTNLLLVNADNPLPESYDSDVREQLVEIDPKYRNNDNVTQIHKDIYPYVVAMVANAQKDGVDLRVWSPFRSYAIQKDLFQKQVDRVGGDEAKAATVVARPGTSEHNTGLCADFNMASDAFENTAMYTWMTENAENYGFVMRYREDKQPITGVIHESWHWRFVGIKAAKEMNKLDMCLEEYVEYLGNKKGE